MRKGWFQVTQIIDTDSHAVEAADIWTSRMSRQKWGSNIPHVRYVAEEKSDMWFVGDVPIMPVGFCVITDGGGGSVKRDEATFPQFLTRYEDMHPAAYDPVQRASVMDAQGISVAVLYPNLGFVGPDIYRVVSDSPLEYQVEIAKAYNDWILDWERQVPGRFVPLACIPYWDIPSAVAEIERCADAGHHGFVMTGAPELHGEPMLPDPHWYPMWAAAEATGLPVSFHVGGAGGFVGARHGSAERANHPNVQRIAMQGTSAVRAFTTAASFLGNGVIIADLLMSGILPRFPTLKFIAVESGVGWIPFVLEALDFHAQQFDLRGERPEFEELPSFYFHRQVYANSWFERLTPYHIETIGAKNILFETDFPHPTCLINEEIDQAMDRAFAGITDEDRAKILWKNAFDLFQLDGRYLQGSPRTGRIHGRPSARAR